MSTKEGRLAVKVFHSKQVAHNHLLRTVCLLSLVRSLSLFFWHMHVLVTTAAWLRTAVNLFTYLCVFTAHICWQNALNRACLCVCVGGVWESELLSEPAFGGVFCSMLISFYFCIRVPVFLSLIKAAGNLCGDYPYSVLITSCLLYFLCTHPCDVLALPILFFTDLFHSSSSFSCRLTVWARGRTHTTAQKVLLNFISPRRIDKCSHINLCTI